MTRPWHIAYFQMLIFITLIVGCAGKLPVVGYDKNGAATMARISEEKYAEHLSAALVDAQDSLVPALNAQTHSEKEWKLRTAMLGLAFNAAFQLGPFGFGVKPRIRAALANGEKPPIP